MPGIGRRSWLAAVGAASHMPMTAAALAAGIAEGAVIDGDSASPAAELRSALTALLTEHVYLSGIAVATAYATAPNSPEFQAAAAGLDKNSVAVADAVGSVAPDQRDTFLAAWRAHIGDFVSYAVAAKAGDDQAKANEVADLMAYMQSQGAFFEQITAGALPAADVTASLDEHAAALAAAVDALATGDPTAFDLLKTAGDHMAMGADALAGGIVTATETDGDFVDYALAAAAGDEAGKQQQLDDLNAYRASAGQFFADNTAGALAAADVAETLGHHAETLAGAIDSFSGALVDR